MIHAHLRAALCASLALAGTAQAADARKIYLVSLAEPPAAIFENPAQLGNAKRAAGWQPYSIKLGDTYYSYQRIEPVAKVIGLAVDLIELARATKDDRRDPTHRSRPLHPCHFTTSHRSSSTDSRSS